MAVNVRKLRPDKRRLCLAFAVAPLASAFALVLSIELAIGTSLDRFLDRLLDDPLGFVSAACFLGLIGTYPIMILLAVPLYCALVGRVGFSPWPPVIAGCLIGVIACLAMAPRGGVHGNPGFDALIAFAGSGGMGGFVFWAIAIWRSPQLTPDPRPC